MRRKVGVTLKLSADPGSNKKSDTAPCIIYIWDRGVLSANDQTINPKVVSGGGDHDISLQTKTHILQKICLHCLLIRDICAVAIPSSAFVVAPVRQADAIAPPQHDDVAFLTRMAG